jgi:GMP synthase (glutamine-hydrolysing)
VNGPVWIIQHVAAEGPGLLGQVLGERQLSLRTFRVHEGDSVPRVPEGASGLVVMGGPMGVYEADRHPHLAEELALLREAVRRRLPILGVCLGSQLLAAALGARVYPSGFKEIGWEPLRRLEEGDRDPVFRNLPTEFTGFHWHGDVFDLPPGASALASSRRTPVQAFRAGRSAYGILFHLEVGEEQISGMTEVFASELRDAGISGAGIREGIPRHGRELERLGRLVFGAWADLLG